MGRYYKKTAADVVKGEAGRIAEGDVCIYIHTYTYTYMYMCYVCVISCTCEWIASWIVFWFSFYKHCGGGKKAADVSEGEAGRIAGGAERLMLPAPDTERNGVDIVPFRYFICVCMHIVYTL